jgi:broad specificity phosphatase PhoE
MAVITLVRHGQASYMQEDYDRLSPLGELQARKLGEWWVQHDFDIHQVFRGPAKRHRGTCDIVGEVMRTAGRSWPEPVIIDDLDEFDAGKVMQLYLPVLIEQDAQVRRLNDNFRAAQHSPEAGKLLQALFEEVAHHWCVNGFGIDHCESWPQFRDRIGSAFARIRVATPKGTHTAVFTSAGPISATLAHVLGLDGRKFLDLLWTSRNCSFSEFLMSGDRLSLASFNSIPHLDNRDLLTFR